MKARPASLARPAGVGSRDQLKVYTVPRLPILEEIGYLPIDHAGADFVFQLISRRYKKGPIILTSNQSLGPGVAGSS